MMLNGRDYSAEIGRSRYVKYSYCKLMVTKAVAICQKMDATAYFFVKDEYTNRN